MYAIPILAPDMHSSTCLIVLALSIRVSHKMNINARIRYATYVITVFPAPAIRGFSKSRHEDSLDSVLTNSPTPEYCVFITVHPKTKGWMAQQPLTGVLVMLGKYVSLFAKVVVF